MSQKESSYLDAALDPRIQSKLLTVQQTLAENLTPFMIIEEREIEQSLNYFKRHFPFARIFYAVKANTHPDILRMVKDQGFGVDVASINEIQLAVNAGFSADQLIHSNPHKDEASIRHMVQNPQNYFSFDSAAELQRVASVQSHLGLRQAPRALLRIVPDRNLPSAAQVDLSEKFGADLLQAKELLKLADTLGLNPAGLSFHIGSNCAHPERLTQAIQVTHSLMLELNSSLGLKLNTLNIGGGFPNQRHIAKGSDELDHYFAQVAESLLPMVNKGFEVIVEPGRCIAGPCGISVMKVIGRKFHKDHPWLILDDGIYGSLNPVIHDRAWFTFFPVDQKYYAPEIREHLIQYKVGGPTCDSFDTLPWLVSLPRELQIGDALFVVDNGAYSLEVATHFNGFAPAKAVFKSKSSSHKRGRQAA